MERIWILFYLIPIIAPILLILYDVFIPQTNYKVLKEKIFLKLGILGIYFYFLSPYCLVFILLILIFILKTKHKSSYDIVCIMLVFISFSQSLHFFISEGLSKMIPLALIVILGFCTTLVILGKCVLYFFKAREKSSRGHED